LRADAANVSQELWPALARSGLDRLARENELIEAAYF